MQKAMHAYFMKYRFTHPVKEDFLKTIEEVSGKNLRWYFNQAIYGTAVLDYEVKKKHSFPAHWYEEQKKTRTKDDKKTIYLSRRCLHRKTDFTTTLLVESNFHVTSTPLHHH